MNLLEILKLVESGEMNSAEAHETIQGELSRFRDALRNVNLDELAAELSEYTN